VCGVREIDDGEGRRLERVVRRVSRSVVMWRRAQMVVLSAQNVDTLAIARWRSRLLTAQQFQRAPALVCMYLRNATPGASRRRGLAPGLDADPYRSLTTLPASKQGEPAPVIITYYDLIDPDATDEGS
jgi:hypothetical protein